MSEVNQTEKSFFVQIDLVYTPVLLNVFATIPGYITVAFNSEEGEHDYQLLQLRLFNLVETACLLKYEMKFNDLNLFSGVECNVATSPTMAGEDHYGLMVYEDKMTLYRLNSGEKISKPDETNSVQICEIGGF
jgi:hypothetical protein